MKEQEQYLEDKYGAIYPEEIDKDERGIFMKTYHEYDDDNGGQGVDVKKVYFEDKDLPLLAELNLISL